MFFKFFSMGR